MLYSRHVQFVSDSCHIICALVLHMGFLMKKTIGMIEQSHEWWSDVDKVAFTYGQWNRIRENGIKN